MSLSIEGEYLWYLFAKQSFTYEDQFNMVLNEFPLEDYPRILEIGCGVGYFLSKLDEKGYKCTGIDMNVERINLAKKLNLLWGKSNTFYESRAIDFKPVNKNLFDAAMWMNVPLDIETLTGEFLSCVKNNLRKGGKVIFDYLKVDKKDISQIQYKWTDELFHAGDDFLPNGTYTRNVIIDYSQEPWVIRWVGEKIESEENLTIFDYDVTLSTVNPSSLRKIYAQHGLSHVKEIRSGKIEFDGVPSGLSFVVDLFVNEDELR